VEVDGKYRRVVTPLSPQQSPHIVVVGTGPAGLMAAEAATNARCRVTIFDQMRAPGRKFLIAGRGGLNLTHSEPPETLLTRYAGSAADVVRQSIVRFTPNDVIAWSEAHGQTTFVGSSGRVFPKAMKASPLLRAWLADLDRRGVQFHFSHRMADIKPNGSITFETASGQSETINADAIVLALGGASWPRLGSDGSWQPLLQSLGADIAPMTPSNCGVLCTWSEHLASRHHGAPLKRIALHVEGSDRHHRGEAILTRTGLEGGAIYAAGADIRRALVKSKSAKITIDLRPDMSTADIEARVSKPRGKASLANHLRKTLSLDAAAIALVNEHRNLPNDTEALTARIKACSVMSTGFTGFARAISTAGGVSAKSLDDNLMLSSAPGVFIAGEMLDFDAPTGGYLLQAAFATGQKAGRTAAAWAKKKNQDQSLTSAAVQQS
jgi:uncharacterized flavoprotein (TIGR03862 family)